MSHLSPRIPLSQTRTKDKLEHHALAMHTLMSYYCVPASPPLKFERESGWRTRGQRWISLREFKGRDRSI